MRNPLVIFLAAFVLVSIPPIAAAQDLPKPAPATEASIADADVTPPRVIYSPEPTYPPDARTAGHQGTSILSLVVGRDGYVHDISVVRKLDAELDESAVATATSWRYEPARKDDDPVEVRIQVKIRFRLYEGDRRKIAELWDRSENSDPKADWALSKAYLQGLGVPQDAQLGLWFLKRAADWNLPEAQFQMGEHFHKDPNAPRDDVAAYMWYALSKRAGGKQGEQMLKVLASEMSAAQLAEAETRVNYWPEDPPK